MPDMRWLRGTACDVTPAERVARGAAAVVATAFASAFAAGGATWCAVPAALCATLLAVGAVTGWCPTTLLSSRSVRRPSVNAMGQPDARDVVVMETTHGGRRRP